MLSVNAYLTSCPVACDRSRPESLWRANRFGIVNPYSNHDSTIML